MFIPCLCLGVYLPGVLLDGYVYTESCSSNASATKGSPTVSTGCFSFQFLRHNIHEGKELVFMSCSPRSIFLSSEQPKHWMMDRGGVGELVEEAQRTVTDRLTRLHSLDTDPRSRI